MVDVEVVLSHSSQSAGQDFLREALNGQRYLDSSRHDGGSSSPLHAKLVVVAVLVADVVAVDVPVVVEHELQVSGHFCRTTANRSQNVPNVSHDSGSSSPLQRRMVVVVVVVVVSGQTPQSAGHTFFTSSPIIVESQLAAV